MKRPSATMILATVALLAALDAPAVALKLVTSANVKDGTITKRDIARNTITGDRVKDASITVTDLATSARPTTPSTTPSGLAGYEVVTGNAPDVSGLWGTAVAQCPTGKRVVGGGFGDDYSSGNPVRFYRSRPAVDGSAWYVNATGGYGYSAYAICVTA